MTDVPFVNAGLVDSLFLRDAPWAEGHGATQGQLGGGMIYYAIVHALRAKLCICIGSGGGFVPRIMRQAQRDMGGKGETHLVDANLPDSGWGSPQYLDEGSYFRTEFPDVIIHLESSEQAARATFSDCMADYIHIDGDHSYAGCKRDVELYMMRLKPNGVMTMHDTLTFCLKPVKGKTHELSARILPDGSPCTKAMGSACLKAGCLLSTLQSEGLRSTVVSLVEKFWRRRLYRGIDSIIANSHFTKSELTRNQIAAENVEIIPVPPSIPEQWTARLDSSVDPPLLLYVGQMSSIKGASEFVAALKQVKGLSWKASMIGDGPDRETIEAEIRQAGLDKQIELHGFVARQDMAAFYRRASILVFPTLAPESWGLVGIEAMWFGLPVIAYDVGAINEWLQDGSNGYLVKPGEIETIAKRIRGLLENKSRYGELRIQAKKSTQRWLNTDHFRSAVNQLYVDVTGGRNADRH